MKSLYGSTTRRAVMSLSYLTSAIAAYAADPECGAAGEASRLLCAYLLHDTYGCAQQSSRAPTIGFLRSRSAVESAPVVAAKALSVNVPQSLIATADEVIE
jgi:hypothetical protein